MTRKKNEILSFVLFTLLILSCSKDQIQMPDASSNQDESVLESRSGYQSNEFYALTEDQQIAKYNVIYSKRPICITPITGLVAQEKIMAIDFRPATGQLYGVSNQSRLYTIHPLLGIAVAINATPFAPAINGKMIGFDFNPTVDRIRLVTDQDQNLRLHPETGAIAAVDGVLNPASTQISGAAYTNNFSGATATTLYDISTTQDMLFTQIPPNNGTLVSVGSLGVDIEGELGFDISFDNSFAIVSTSDLNKKQSQLYTINLETGRLAPIGSVKEKIISIAIPTRPVAYATDTTNTLLIFNPLNKETILTKKITGLAIEEKIVGIDLRPLTGQLYALSSASKLYTINTANGLATAISNQPFSTLLAGTSFGFDFNPTVDRIRVVSNTGQNLRLHPVTGAIASVDPNLNPGSPMVDAAAYTNSYAGATSTTLYDIDFQADRMYKQDPANAGTLISIGLLGKNVSASNGFDIAGISNKAFGIFKVYDRTYLFQFNLNVGYAQHIKRDFNYNITGFTIGLGL